MCDLGHAERKMQAIGGQGDVIHIPRLSGHMQRCGVVGQGLVNAHAETSSTLVRVL